MANLDTDQTVNLRAGHDLLWWVRQHGRPTCCRIIRRRNGVVMAICRNCIAAGREVAPGVPNEFRVSKNAV